MFLSGERAADPGIHEGALSPCPNTPNSRVKCMEMRSAIFMMVFRVAGPFFLIKWEALAEDVIVRYKR